MAQDEKRAPAFSQARGEGEVSSPQFDVVLRNQEGDAVPDGGGWAWASSAAGHLVLMNTWGYNSSFGLFQSYYMAKFDRSGDDIAWIGSLQVFLLFFVGTFSGRLTDAGYFRAVFAAGSLLTLGGIFASSVSRSYWQLLLAQGICTGLGNGCLFTPALAIISTYFKARRPLAFGVCATGTATGGLVFPLIARELIPRLGLHWTLRAMGLVQVVTLVAANLMTRPRTPPKRGGSWVDWAAFLEMEYTFFACSIFCCFLGMYFAFYYLTAFATTQLAHRSSYLGSLYLLMVVNGVGYIGRFVPNLIAHRIGSITLSVPFIFAAGICLLLWPFVTTSDGLYTWAAVYGIAAGGIQSLFPPGLTSLTSDLQKAGVRMGMVCTTNSLATLSGPPIAGAIITASGGRYLGAQLFAGVSLMVGAFLMLAARIARRRKFSKAEHYKI